jgi:hypothetical protein
MKYAYYASGFREKRGNRTGTKLNARIVRDSHPLARVTYVEWNDDPKEYARDLADMWTHGDTVIAQGYSWGAGNWLHKFLWELFRLNPLIKLDHVFFIDPVVRSKWPWMRWLAVTDHGTIDLPDNIVKWHGVRQDLNEPNASNLRIGAVEIPRTKLLPLHCIHSEIDNHKNVRNITLEIANKYL